MDRRTLLKFGANALGMGLLPLGGAAWGARLEQAEPRLVVVFLRGAVDGLNVVVPYAANTVRPSPSPNPARLMV